MFQTMLIRILSFGFSGFGIYFAPLCFEFRASDFAFFPPAAWRDNFSQDGSV
jgi:hypothetical protein